MPRDVPAIDGRDKLGVQRMKVASIVPIVEVTPKLLQFVHRLERVFKSLCCLLRANPSKIARGKRGKEIEAHICRGGSVGDDRFRVFLKIIERKEIVRGRNKSLKKTPRTARSQAKSLGIIRRQRLQIWQPWRKADPTCHRRRTNPQKSKRDRNR